MKGRKLERAVEGKLFYSDTFGSYIVMIDDIVYSATLNPLIKNPTKEQINILMKEVSSYIDFETKVKATEELIKIT